MRIIKNLFQTITLKVQAFSLLIGLAVGFALTVATFSWLVPSGTEMTRVFSERTLQNQMRLRGCNMIDEHHMGMNTMMGSNPYMMSRISNEQQFLKEMILHHDAAIAMSKQVLGVQGISSNVKQLAESIIATQNAEIQKMKGWIPSVKSN